MISMTLVHALMGAALFVFTVKLWRLFEDIRINGDGA